MAQSLRKLRVAVNAPRLLPHALFILAAKPDSFIFEDMKSWAEKYEMPAPVSRTDFILVFLALMTFLKEFRNVFYFRFGLRAKIFAFLCRPLESLVINTRDIGPGLFIQHGMGTLISAESIGRRCWINQQVTIGYSNRDDRPTIGDNVRILSGAKVVGKLRIANNATVGLNTVVLTNVPEGATVFGIPGQIIWRARTGTAKPVARQDG